MTHGELLESAGGILTVRNASWNAAIPPYGTVSVDFQGVGEALPFGAVSVYAFGFARPDGKTGEPDVAGCSYASLNAGPGGFLTAEDGLYPAGHGLELGAEPYDGHVFVGWEFFRFIILVTDAGYWVDNRFGITSMEEMGGLSCPLWARSSTGPCTRRFISRRAGVNGNSITQASAKQGNVSPQRRRALLRQHR